MKILICLFVFSADVVANTWYFSRMEKNDPNTIKTIILKDSQELKFTFHGTKCHVKKAGVKDRIMECTYPSGTIINLHGYCSDTYRRMDQVSGNGPEWMMVELACVQNTKEEFRPFIEIK